jgi:hypothetical protein
VKRQTISELGKVPELGPVTAQAVELVEDVLRENPIIKEEISYYSSKTDPSIRDLLALAFFRIQLAILEPGTREGDSPSGKSLWKYWLDRPSELRRLDALRDRILRYLLPGETLKGFESRARARMIEVIAHDDVTLLALLPMVEKPHASSGRPVARPQVAARALQMKIDSGRTWQEITNEVCDCGQSVHDGFCGANLRQSVRALKRLLKKCGIKVPIA